MEEGCADSAGISDVSVANEPILLNGSLVRPRGTESYLVRAVFWEDPPPLCLVGFSTRSEVGLVLTEYAREKS